MDSKIRIKGEVNEFSGSKDILKQELIKTKKRAEQAEKLKSAFLNNISHEIRTPLNGILGFLDFFNDDLAKEDRDQFIAIMRKSGERLLATLNSIIEISKLESGNMELNYSVFNLNNAMDTFNFEIKKKYANSNIAYSCTLALQEEQTWIETDYVKMFEILGNLIDNAFKFTSEGYVNLTVKQEKNTLICEIEDTGIGIRDKDRKRIFESFCQADSQLKRKFEGNGLGLSISKQLIQMMGGELKHESPPHNGAKFICIFPRIIFDNIKKADTKDKVIISGEPLWMKKFNKTEVNAVTHSFFEAESLKKRCS